MANDFYLAEEEFLRLEDVAPAEEEVEDDDEDDEDEEKDDEEEEPEVA